MGIKRVLTKDIGSGEGGKPLTLQMALSVLLLIPCFFLFIAGYLVKPTDSTLTVRVWLWILLLASIALAIWHFRDNSSKRNIHPDVLGMLSKPNTIFEAGPVQLCFVASQGTNDISVVTLIQNMHDNITSVQLNVILRFSRESRPVALPPLKHDLGNSSVIMAEYRYLLSSRQMQEPSVKITPSIRATASQRSRVRFNRRQVFDTKMKPWLSILMLAGPVAVFGGGRVVTLRLNAGVPSTGASTTPQWRLHELWSPVSQRTKGEIVGIIGLNSGIAFS